MSWSRRFLVLVVLSSVVTPGCNGKKKGPSTGTPPPTESKTTGKPRPGETTNSNNQRPKKGSDRGKTPTRRTADYSVVDTQRSIRVFDLLTNSHLAHSQRDGLFISTAEIGFYKYTHGRWKSSFVFNAKVGDAKVALVDGKQALLRFPLASATGTGSCALRLGFKPATSGQRVSVFVNGKEITTYSFRGTAREDVLVALKPGLLKRGENKLRLYFRSSGTLAGHRTAGALYYVAVSQHKGGGFHPEGKRPSLVVGSPNGRSLSDQFSRYDWYVQIPKSARLVCPARVVGGSAELEALVQTDGSPEVIVFRHSRPAGLHRQGADLARFGGQVVRLSLRVKAPAGTTVSWLDGCGFYVPKVAPFAAPKTPARHVFIWMVDTLRSDRLRVYNPKTRVKTPNFDAFVKTGVTFLHSMMQGAHSIPSHASVLTGLYPGKHGMYNDDNKQPSRSTLLSEVFQRAGFTTAAFLSNGYVSSAWGYKQGWSYYKNFIRDREPSHTGYVMPRLTKWLEKNKTKRLFMYIATIDPHVAYRYREEYTKQYDGKEPYSGRFKKYCNGFDLDKIRSGKYKLSARDKQRIKALYDGEVTFNDHYFGVFVQKLKELGLYDNAVIVVISDHGDEFWEHGSVGHGQSLHGELVDVPFIVRAPGLSGGRTLDEMAEGVDLFPTVLNLAGVKIPELVQGGSLLSQLLRKSSHMPWPGFASRPRIERPMRTGDSKYLVRDPDTDSLYDRRTDPLELRNVRDDKPIAYRHMRDVISFYLAFEKRWRKSEWGVPNNVTPAFHKEAR
ncbi:MAG: sulfatase [Myxococcales bacterium]|nr:sulfatase [Myxococcales bacterium]